MHSIRVQFLAFIAAIMLVLLILLNILPIASSRDLVFEEKKDSLSSQAAVIASSLSGLERLSQESITEVLRILDISGFSRLVVTDAEGVVLYDDGGRTGVTTELEDIVTALSGKTVFRSLFADSAFSSAYAMPVSSQGSTKGAVYLTEYDTERARIILDIQSEIRVMSVTIVLIVLVVAGIIFNLLLRRMQELVRRMKNHGYCVYYLSNIPQDVLDLLRQRGVLDRFDGGVASCEVHINKPDPRIYQALLDKYHLKAEECVFIDDRPENVQTAFSMGFAGVQMKDSVGTLVRSLATCNVSLR